jgi:hypothetical protein
MEGDVDRARDAYRRGAYAEAIPLLTRALQRDPSEIAAHLLLARCFRENGQVSTACQLLKTLVLHPEIRMKVPLPPGEVDEIFVETLKHWAWDIEKAGFRREDLEAFDRALRVYEKVPGARATEMRGLRDDLRLKRPVIPGLGDLFRRPR